MEQLSGCAAPELAVGLDRLELRGQRAPPVSWRRCGPARPGVARVAAAPHGVDLPCPYRARRRTIDRLERLAVSVALRSCVRVPRVPRAGAMRDSRLLRDVGPRRLRLSVPRAAAAGRPPLTTAASGRSADCHRRRIRLLAAGSRDPVDRRAAAV